MATPVKIAVFLQSANHPRFVKVLHDFADGVKTTGDQVFLTASNAYVSCDVAVFFGSWKDRDLPHHNIKREIVANAPKFIVLETPLIGRQRVSEVMQDEWYRIGIGGFLRDTGTFDDGSNRLPDRWLDLRKKLDITGSKNSYRGDGEIVLALQLPGDASLRGASIEQWCVESCKTIRSITDRPICVRLPQLNRAWDPVLGDLAQLANVRFQRGTFDNLRPTLEKAFCTVTYTSGLAIDSLINGCPTIAMDPGNFAYPISPNCLSQIEDIQLPDLDQWLWNLSHYQWHESEISEGKPWCRLRALL